MVLFSSRWLRSRLFLLVLLILAFLAFLHRGPKQPVIPVNVEPVVHPNQAFHLLVPATSTNDNFCRLLLSAAVNRYPVPILINWGAKENKDAYVQHLAKVWTILDYLEILLARGKKDDLVLIIDGFDIHFQLPPEVLISRYYQENERANKRIAAQMGADVAAANNISQTVIFGHDKLCWPTDWKRPACWLVPEASDPKKAYGPVTDSNPTVSRARWLNSGTILGPVDHVRDIFRATLDLIHANHTTDSDQFYFANVQAVQEHARHLLEPDPYRGINKNEKNFPEIEPGNRTEYGFGLDYEGVLFQTMAFYREFIAWQTFDGIIPKVASSIWKTTNRNQQIIKRDPYYSKILPEDIALARPPFSAAGPASPVSQPGTNTPVGVHGSKLPTNITWRDLSLGANANSRQIFPLLHFTGPKEFRRKWYPRLWFLPWAEDLLKASVKAPREPLSDRPLGGKIWWAGETGNETKVHFGEKGGAWADSGEFLPWEGLCGAHEPLVFGKELIFGLDEVLEEEKKKAEGKKEEGKKEEGKKEEGKQEVKEEVKGEAKPDENQDGKKAEGGHPEGTHEVKPQVKEEHPTDAKEGTQGEIKGDVKVAAADGTREEAKEAVKAEPTKEVKAEATEVKAEATQGSVKEPPKDLVKEPVREPAKESAAEPVREPTKESAGEPVREPTKESAAERVKEAVKEPVREPITEPAKESAAEPVREPVKEAIQEPAKDSTLEPVKEPVREPAKESTPEPTKEPVRQPETHPAREPEEEADQRENAKVAR